MSRARERIPLRRLLRQHAKDTLKAWRHGHLRPALWETRRWLVLVEKHKNE